MSSPSPSAPGGGSGQRLFGGVAGGLAVTALSVGQQVLMVPLFVHMWSTAEYATWLVLFSITSLLAIADFGFHPLSINRYQVALAGTGRRAVVALSRDVRTFVNSYILNAALVFTVLILGCIVADPVALLGLKGETEPTLFAALLLSVASGVSLNMMSGCTALYRAHLKIGRLMSIRLSMQVATIIAQAAVLLTKCSVLAMCAAMLAVNVAGLAFMSLRDIPSFANCSVGRWWRFSVKDYGRTLKAALPFVVPTAADPIMNQGPVFLLALVGPGPLAVVIFNLCKVLLSVPRMLVQHLCGVLGPEIGAAFVRDDRDSVRHNLKIAIIVSAVIIGVSVGAMFGLVQPVYVLWTLNTVPFDALTFWLMALALSASSHTFAAASALLYSNQPGLVTRFQLVRVTLLCVLTAVLGWQWGAPGAAAALLISEVVASAVPFFRALTHRFPVTTGEVLRWTISSLGLWFAVFAALTSTLAHVLDLHVPVQLAIGLAVTAVCAVGVAYWEMRTAFSSRGL